MLLQKQGAPTALRRYWTSVQTILLRYVDLVGEKGQVMLLCPLISANFTVEHKMTCAVARFKASSAKID